MKLSLLSDYTLKLKTLSLCQVYDCVPLLCYKSLKRLISPMHTHTQTGRPLPAAEEKPPCLTLAKLFSIFPLGTRGLLPFICKVNCHRRRERGDCSDKRLNFPVLKSKPKAAGLMVLWALKKKKTNHNGLTKAYCPARIGMALETLHIKLLPFLSFSWPAQSLRLLFS